MKKIGILKFLKYAKEAITYWYDGVDCDESTREENNEYIDECNSLISKFEQVEEIKEISMDRYECSCGYNFKIENENKDDTAINYCPYCGSKRFTVADSDSEKCIYDGKFNYLAIENKPLDI